ncbi:CoA transferase [Actinoallomurus sp. NPDC052308]|uniref:CoA transferase n=1 Tax=Actinoallomurus sp. NPDC052308 TaxID=3155530 RepID=UPI0034201D9B
MTASPAHRPLDGFRVLDFTQNVAGPLAGTVLADLGAEVIKVEAPGGEAARRITSSRPGLEHVAPYFLPNNRGKKSVVIDLKSEEGLRQALALADTADVVLDGFRPGVMDRLGLGPETLRARNPRLVYAALSGYGGYGPVGRRPCIDMMIQAESGLVTGLRSGDGTPEFVRSTIVDAATGHVLAQAVLAALLNRERHGVADVVRVAMYDVACSLQSNSLTMAANTASNTPRPTDGRSPFATEPSGAFRCGDGNYLVLAAYVPKHWKKLTEVLGRPDLPADPRFADQRQRGLHRRELTAELTAALRAHAAAEWVEIFERAGLMATRVQTWREVVSSPQFAENQLAVTVTDGERTETVIRTPARYDGFTPAGTTPTPALGRHNDELLPPSGAA